MVEAITNIAHVMGVKTIAEFVETEAIAEELTRMGVDYAQGYWFGRPEPIELP
jgi:EAL domain-containing protein (putative c-di-GMP-specific phosphodiesterase class I)